MKQAIDTANFPSEALAEIQKLQLENASLESKNAVLESENARLLQELLYFRRFHYGRRSEKRMPEQPEGQLFLAFGESAIPEETPDIKPVVEEIRIEAHNRRKKREQNKAKPRRMEIPADIERRTRVIEPDGINPEEMIKIGQDVREILHCIPCRLYVDRIIRPIYKAKIQDKESVSTQIYQAEAIESIIPKSFAGASLLVQIIISKYVDHLPVYRQLQIFKRQGIHLSASTISGWIQEIAALLNPLYQKLVQEILSSDYIQVDESTIPVIDNEKKRAVKGYIWAVLDVIGKQIFFHYDKGSRSQKTLVSLLRNYKGAVQSDGYEAYSIYEHKNGVLLLSCWAHVRRKFENALSEDKDRATMALDYIGLLYQIEANLKEKQLSDEEISKERKRLSYPILLDFEQWMHTISTELLPRSLMGKAVSYTFSLFHRLVRYVSHGKYQIDNNPIENAIRPLALGRKNYLFCGNHDTAQDTALFYSFFGSCKQNGINAQEWLLDVLSRIKDCKTSELAALLPANWNA